MRQQQGYVNRKKKADNAIRVDKNGCNSHQPQNWDRSERYGNVNTLDWEIAPFLTRAQMPRSCKGKVKREESRLSRGESEGKAIGTKREPKLEKDGKREGTESEAREEGMPKMKGGAQREKKEPPRTKREG